MLDKALEAHDFSGSSLLINSTMSNGPDSHTELTDMEWLRHPSLTWSDYVKDSSGAPKVIKITMSNGPESQREFKDMEWLRHPNIPQVYSHFAIDSKIKCIEMSYCPHGDLHQQINDGGHYTNTDVAKWITQILSALRHVHEHCVIHRDIKPANIILGNGMTAMLADFGIAILVYDAPYAARCGTIGYEAPEIVAGKVWDPCRCLEL